MPLPPDKLNELHQSIHAEIQAIARPEGSPVPPHAVGLAIPPALLNLGLTTIAGQIVPVLTDLALAKVGPAVESFAESHAAWVRQFVSMSAMEFAIKVLKDLETAPAPPPGPAPSPAPAPAPAPNPTPAPAPAPAPKPLP